MSVGHGAAAADAHDAGCRCGRSGARAADADDADFWFRLPTGQAQLMLMMLAFGVGWPRGSGS